MHQLGLKRSFGPYRCVSMNTQGPGKSKFLNSLFKPAGSAMESRFRHLLHDPMEILRGADVQPGPRAS